MNEFTLHLYYITLHVSIRQKFSLRHNTYKPKNQRGKCMGDVRPKSSLPQIQPQMHPYSLINRPYCTCQFGRLHNMCVAQLHFLLLWNGVHSENHISTRLNGTLTTPQHPIRNISKIGYVGCQRLGLVASSHIV